MNSDEKKNYKRKFKYISVRLFKEERHILSDIVFIQYNVNADNLNIYDLICYRRKRTAFCKICKSFLKPKKPDKNNEIARNRMKELIEKEPTISARKIKQITGYDWHIITRYYMKLKIELDKQK